MHKKTILGVMVDGRTKEDTLEKIKKDIGASPSFVHVVSINPENIVLAQHNREFREVVNTAQITITDGVGVVVAARVLGVPVGERCTGVGLMETLLKGASRQRLRVMLIGGKAKLAEELADCYQRLQPQAKIVGLEGVKNIKNPQPEEGKIIFSIVSAIRPHVVFVSFGSPYQELWIHENRHKFGHTCVIGVGGAFDFLSGRVRRAPKWLQTIGGEWLFRLLRQPWRLKRQLRLLEFIWLVLKAKVTMTQ